MNNVRNVLLGSAAAIVAASAASAADLPSRKSEPASYVKICDAYGEGFFFIPGTDTCLHIGGLARAEYGYGSPSNIYTLASYSATGGTNAATQLLGGVASGKNISFIPSNVLDVSGFQGRGLISADARTATGYGVARTYVSIRALNGTGIYTGADNYATGSFTGQAGGVALTLEQAIVQFAGFTFGRTTRDVFSFMPGVPLGSFSQSSYAGATNVLAYQTTFGGGFSGSIALEDRSGQSSSTAPGYIDFGPGGAVAPAGSFTGAASTVGGAVTNGPLTYPALAANLRVEQSWGAAQVMALTQQNSASTAYATGAAGSPNVTLTKQGYAVGAGLKINLPMIAPGDVIHATAAYADGDIVQLQSFGSSAVTSGFGREVGGLMRQDRDLYVMPSGAACTATTMNAGCFNTESTKGWSTAVYFNHFWTPTLRQWVFFSYLTMTPGTQTRNTDWTLGGLSKFSLTRIGTQTVWSPVKDMDIAGEIEFVKLDQKFAATSVANGGTGIATCQAGGPGFGSAACNNLKIGGPNSAGGSDIEARMRVERRF